MPKKKLAKIRAQLDALDGALLLWDRILSDGYFLTPADDE